MPHTTSKETDVFNRFADDFAFWATHITPRNYSAELDTFLPAERRCALDVGCGPGYLTYYLAEHFDSVIGLDLSIAMLKSVQQNPARQTHDNITFVLGDLLRAPLPSHQFDFIGSDNALHDIALAPALTALKRLLRPGGHLMVRDLVAKDSHQSHSTPYQIARTLKRIPSYMRRYDVRTALRLLKFELHPAWLRHRSRGLRLTPDTFEMTYGAHFPDGRIVHYGWASALYWQAPLT
ncbi:MAG: class I SAM-dependent methyltransferase [Anaerolineae bacterium]|nr:class I SAM-dependent methyltransferase [Anaerolineae bacterium]MCO5195927.1 class I SAM-dependent methyltransferase [Anaerolineae bacterium]